MASLQNFEFKQINLKYEDDSVLWHCAVQTGTSWLMMGAVRTSETSINFYETRRRNVPTCRHLYCRRRENPKSHKFNLFSLNRYEQQLRQWLGNGDCAIINAWLLPVSPWVNRLESFNRTGRHRFLNAGARTSLTRSKLSKYETRQLADLPDFHCNLPTRSAIGHLSRFHAVTQPCAIHPPTYPLSLSR
jgi:lysozyme family protein